MKESIIIRVLTENTLVFSMGSKIMRELRFVTTLCVGARWLVKESLVGVRWVPPFIPMNFSASNSSQPLKYKLFTNQRFSTNNMLDSRAKKCVFIRKLL